MFNYYISIGFLSIILIPVIVIFLTLIQSVGEDVRKITFNKRKEKKVHKATLNKEIQPQRLKRVK